MSKIVVVTFTNAVDNYGQVLQYYATQEYLNKRGHQVCVHIDEPFQPNRLRIIASRLKHIVLTCFNKRRDDKKEVGRGNASTNTDPITAEKNRIFKQWNESILRNEKLHPRKFNEFKKSHFNMLVCPSSQLSLKSFDACVVGSDQTWSWVGEYNFLTWAPEGAKRLSIAPSVGHKQFSEDEIEISRKYLASFDLLTVREDNGLEFCNKAGRPDAIKILDPTFLLTAENYSRLEKESKQDKPYILLYLLGGEISVPVSDIYAFAEKEGLDVVYVASQGREDEYPKCYAEIGEWLSLIKGATYVFTNSFHGMAFSIIYHKKFLVFPLTGIMNGMNGRVNNLAQLFDIQSSIHTDSLEKVKGDIEYDFVDNVIESNFSLLNEKLKNIAL